MPKTKKSSTLRRRNKTSRQSQAVVKGGADPQRECPDEDKWCPMFDTLMKNRMGNSIWKTCLYLHRIHYHITYIIPRNVNIKSINTLQVPEFFCNINNKNVRCKVKINDMYVACFLQICNNWYAIMRLWGKTLNTGLFARTDTNQAFYHLKDFKLSDDGVISFLPTNYTIKENSIFILSPHDSIKLVLNPTVYSPIEKKNSVEGRAIFKVLNTFRKKKILGHIFTRLTGQALNQR